MKYIQPPRIRPGNHLRVIAPSRSLAFVGQANSDTVRQRFDQLQLSLSFGRHVMERDLFDSSSVKSRITDLHEAFEDPSVHGILTVIGGYNSIDLLPHVDWDLIRRNPKILCGYSDVTTLQNAILAKTAILTYSGPHWSTFGMKHHFEQTLEWFRDATFHATSTIRPSSYWTDDHWFVDQEARSPIAGDGWWTIKPGFAEGRAVGGNLSSLLLLQGTEYMPEVERAVLFVEATLETNAQRFAREMHSIFLGGMADSISAIVVGRFQKESHVSRSDLEMVFSCLPVPPQVPIVANVDFGHTNPIMTWPVGGRVALNASGAEPSLGILSEQ